MTFLFKIKKKKTPKTQPLKLKLKKFFKRVFYKVLSVLKLSFKYKTVSAVLN